MSMDERIDDLSESTDSDFFWFAIVVDGDYTGRIGIGKAISPALLGLRSNPVMIEMTPEQALEVNLGWVYNGETFIQETILPTPDLM
jgi:hypothetical protein